MKLGVIVPLHEQPDDELAKLQSLGFSTCQVSCWHDELLSPAVAARLNAAAAARSIEITTIWVGMSGRHVWDFAEGPLTIGLVPPATRAERVATLKRGSDFARWAGAPGITTHVGFIPENLCDPEYSGVVAAIREVAAYCQANGLNFCFETGQETPIVLLRTIQEVGLPNLGVNLDPANLLMYGKANPFDALDVLGHYVRGVHAKDGEYPTDGRRLGEEKPLGQGRVNFPALVARLKALGYDGALTIEREISGPQQIEDIKRAKMFLERLIA